MKVKFSRCTSSNLANVPQVDGQLIYTKDTNEVYLDVGNNRNKISDVIMIANKSSVVTPVLNKLYYETSTDTLFKAKIENNTTVWVDITGATVDYVDNNFLKKDNTTAFTPTADYQPATKKYVDDNCVPYQPFPAEIVTNSTTEAFINSIKALHLPAGSTYLGGVTITDMPFTGNAEVEVYIYPNNVIYCVLRSSNVSPYKWEYNSHTPRGWEIANHYKADIVNYDNTTSQLQALNVQSAIDEINENQVTDVSKLQLLINGLEEDNKRLRATLPSISGQGSDITLENTRENKFVEFSLEGRTEQEQLSGKNLFSGNYSQFDNTGGIGNTYAYFKIPDETKQYTLSVTAKNDFTPNYQYIGLTGNGGSATDGFIWLVDGSNPATIAKGTVRKYTTTETLKYISMFTKNSDTLRTLMNNFDIQLEEGSTATSYEPYCRTEYQHQILGYECPIKNVTGQANIKIQTKNLFDADAFVTEARDKGYTTSQVSKTTYLGKEVLKYQNSLPNLKFMQGKFKENTRYTLKTGVLKTGYNGGNAPYISFVYTDGTEQSLYVDYSSTSFITTTATSRVNKTIDYIRVPDYALGQIVYLDLSVTQLEQGTTATSYVEYEEQNYPFSLRNKNLLNVPSTFELNRFNEFPINLKAGSYIISLEKWTTSGTNGSSVFNIDGTSYSLNNSNKSITVNLAHDITKIYMYSYYDYNSSAGIIVTFTNLMIRKANVTDDTYEPYYEPYDIKAMQGTQPKDDGIHNKRIQRLLSSIEWELLNTNTDTGISTFHALLSDRKTGSNLAPLSNYFTYVGEIVGGANMYNKDECFSFYYNPTFDPSRTDIYFNYKTSSLQEFETFLDTSNAVIEYELADSALENNIIPYNETQQAQYNARKEATSYNDITYISSESDELGFNMNVVALISTTAPEVSSEIGFNNTNTSMQSTNVQDAIVEVNSAIGDINTVLDEINGVEV